MSLRIFWRAAPSQLLAVLLLAGDAGAAAALAADLAELAVRAAQHLAGRAQGAVAEVGDGAVAGRNRCRGFARRDLSRGHGDLVGLEAALPTLACGHRVFERGAARRRVARAVVDGEGDDVRLGDRDRKSTRLNSSHVAIS